MARPSRFNANASATFTSTTISAALAEQAPPTSAAEGPPTVPDETANRSMVAGPTSALTSFLKEQGIRPRHLNRFARANQPQPSTSAIPENVEQEQAQDLGNGPGGDPEPEVDSDDLDDDYSAKAPSRQPVATKSTRVPNSISERAPPIRSRAQAGLKKRDKEDSPEPPMKPKPGKYADRKPGMIATCECGKRFTVTRYTPSEPGRGQLCDACSKESFGQTADSRDGPPPPKKRKPKKNQTVKALWSEHTTQTLQMACISVIAKNIESLGALSSVGSVNLEKICKIVCKHRELNPINLPLFLDVSHTHLRLFDCINLTKNSLMSIAIFCPRLQHLTLNLCGHLDGEVLINYGRRLRHLRELDLFGPYLVRAEAWLELFSLWSKPPGAQATVCAGEAGLEIPEDISDEGLELPRQITVFRLKQSPRFNLQCVQALADTCKKLTALRLDDIGLLDDQALKVIANAKFENLTKLSIANAGIHNGATGESLTSSGVIQLLASVGPGLEELDISQNTNLTDAVLSDGLAIYCRALKKLNIGGLKMLSSKGVKDLFDTWNRVYATKLETLNLSRCIRVDNSGLLSILDHAASNLQYLDLNSVDELRSEALERLSMEASKLIELDLSFVRDVDDFLIKACLDTMRNLKTLRVYGDNRVSDLCPNRKGVEIKGQERAIVVV